MSLRHLYLQDRIVFVELEECNATEMNRPLPETPEGLVLEMTDVGRGKGLPTNLLQVRFGHIWRY